jgi:uncharacterized cupredoxin-like copper-binding protein
MSRKKIAVVALGAGVLAALPGCAQGPIPVDVTLTDFGIESTRTEFEAGRAYEFTITNEGALNHEFMIMPPVGMDQMGMDMGEYDEMALLMVEAEELPPGETVVVEYTFPDSAADEDLEFACHTEGHYEQGMNLGIAVVR